MGDMKSMAFGESLSQAKWKVSGNPPQRSVDGAGGSKGGGSTGRNGFIDLFACCSPV